MKPIQKIYLSGLGAIGSTYASKLYEMNPDCIRIVADKQRIDRYVKSGITVNDKAYPFHYILPDGKAEPADLIFIAVKQHHLGQAIKDISGFVGENTIILSLLNGITSEEAIGLEFGIDKVLHSFCVGIDAVREGTSVRFSRPGKIVFGDRDNKSVSPRVAAVKELFDKARIPYSIPDDIIRELWWKFMLNVGVNQISAILKAPYGVFHKTEDARELMATACREVVCLANRIGVNLTEDDISESIRIINTLSPDGKTSMLQDVEAGRKTEVEIFAGTVIELGSRYGLDTPVNRMLFKMLRTLEQMYMPGL